jgi:hypothetical protein
MGSTHPKRAPEVPMSKPTMNDAAVSKVVSLLERAGERDLARTLAAHHAARDSGASHEDIARLWLTL